MGTSDRDYRYAGGELDLFGRARHWKDYVRARLADFLGDHVLEVGAGLGATTGALVGEGRLEWVCLEPDAGLAARLSRSVAEGRLPDCCRVVRGTIASLPAEARFDTVLYVDVLEHIQDDRAEMRRAAHRLAPGGHVVVLSPAHQWLFSPFDRAIGHFRRYSRRTLAALTFPGLRLVRLQYLDSVGLLASLANRVLLRSSMPTTEQVLFWDRVLVPLSRLVDPALGWSAGKSVVAVWRRV